MLRWLENGEFEVYFQGYSENPSPRAVWFARQVMSAPVREIEPDCLAGAALALMKELEISHLPVVDNGRIVGLVGDRDLLDLEENSQAKVSQLMSRRLLTASPDSPLWAVARIMLNEEVHCVLVVDDEAGPLGILTSLDILACLTYHAPLEIWM